jgi:hypothetical protein
MVGAKAVVALAAMLHANAASNLFPRFALVGFEGARDGEGRGTGGRSSSMSWCGELG